MVVELAAPLRVSPLIKFSRWGLLTLGVLYGGYNQTRLSKKEAAIRVVELKQKAIRDVKLAEEKKLAGEREMKMLAEIAGGKL